MALIYYYPIQRVPVWQTTNPVSSCIPPKARPSPVSTGWWSTLVSCHWAHRPMQRAECGPMAPNIQTCPHQALRSSKTTGRNLRSDSRSCEVRQSRAWVRQQPVLLIKTPWLGQIFPKNVCCCKGRQEANFRNLAESLLRWNQKLNTAMGKEDFHTCPKTPTWTLYSLTLQSFL